MKKFLDLKKSIVDSKNQPTLIQTYLDTIRSSCYKLATPLVSSRHLIPPNDNPNKSMQSKNCQTAHQNDEKMAQKQTKFLPILSQSKNIAQKKDQQINTQNLFTPHKHIPTQFLATESPLQKIDQIFSTLSSNCKSNIQLSENAQKEIVQVILNNLCKLQRKKQYKDSVQLIRNIIIGLSNSNLGEANIFNHSQLKNIGYIVPREGENECEGEQSWEEEELKASQIKHKSQSQECRVELTKNSSTIRRKLQENLENDTKNLKLNHQGNSIYIQEEQQKENSLGYQSQQTQRYESQNRSPYSNSMKSDQSYKWTQQSLYCIQEEQQQYQSSSAKQLSGCKIPEETIQFKKIIYMLESNTNKKSRVQIDEDSNILKQQANKSLFLERIFSSDDGIIAKSNNLNLNRTYTQGDQKYLPQQQFNIDLQQTKLMKKNNLAENIQENSRTIKMLKQFANKSTEQNPTASPKILKSEAKIKGIGGVNKQSLTTNGNGKSKQLADIVNMLKNKYNRNINVKIREQK